MKHSDQISGVCFIACPNMALAHGRMNLYRYAVARAITQRSGADVGLMSRTLECRRLQ